ncbi:hypothetical protein ABTK52_19495, partial [Acinetobacter baumannii]
SLGTLSSADVQVQAVTGKIGPNRDLVNTTAIEMKHTGSSSDGELFECEVSLPDTGHQGYTLRVLPSHPDVSVASE